jgi:peptidoglycan/xylan/chitin deacetylase (PgdA/CDA1 family)
MAPRSPRRREVLTGLAATLAAGGLPAAAAAPKPVYLTIDTGSMVPAEEIAATLSRHGVKATFFLANELTSRGDRALDDGWAPFWKARAGEGHAFGSHTWRHWYFRGEQDGKVRYVAWGGKEQETLDREGVCREIGRVDERFQAIAGRPLDRIWRAPGGKTTPQTLAWAEACGWKHVGWSDAGFLGDELPSDKHPNKELLDRALKRVGPGDVMVMHLGTRDRKEQFVGIFEPLLEGLLKKGLRFATFAGTGA